MMKSQWSDAEKEKLIEECKRIGTKKILGKIMETIMSKKNFF